MNNEKVLVAKVLEESLFADWLSEAGEADSLDVPTRQIEEEVRKILKKILQMQGAEAKVK